MHALSVKDLSLPCWQKRSGCICRCHTRARISQDRNRHFFVDIFGFPSIWESCNVETCNQRRYALQIRFAATKYGLPFAITAGFEVDSNWTPRFSLVSENLCKYTSPGFTMLWELQRWPHEEDCALTPSLREAAIRQRVAEIKRLFSNGQATFRDVDPEGLGWLEKILLRPWTRSLINVQWELVEFLLANSPQHVLKNPRLLLRCAEWLGEGPHMDMLDTLIRSGIDPDYFHADLYKRWPSLPWATWGSEGIVRDPMFVEWISICLKNTPGRYACFLLSSKFDLLTFSRLCWM